MGDPYSTDLEKHWLLHMLERWFSGWIQPDEIFLLLLIGFTLQIATQLMHRSEPRLPLIGRRVGFTVFFLLLGWFLNCDRGLQNVGMRILQSIAVAWAAAGITAVMAFPARMISKTLTSHAQAMGEKAAALRQRRLDTQHRAETERERVIREEAWRLEETRAQAARDEYQRQMDAIRRQETLERREQQQQEAAEREANEQRIAPHKRMVDLAFLRNRVAIEHVMSEARYQKYFKKYLTDDLAIDEYQRRAESLIKVIEDLVHISPQQKRKRNPMAETIERFQQKKADLQDLDIDEDTLEVLEAAIDEAMENGLQDFLR